MSDEQQIFDYLKEGDEEAFSSLFRKYYRDLVLFAGTILPDRKELCEDIVQNVFTDLWNRRNERVIKTSIDFELMSFFSLMASIKITFSFLVFEAPKSAQPK